MAVVDRPGGRFGGADVLGRGVGAGDDGRHAARGGGAPDAVVVPDPRIWSTRSPEAKETPRTDVAPAGLDAAAPGRAASQRPAAAMSPSTRSTRATVNAAGKAVFHVEYVDDEADGPAKPKAASTMPGLTMVVIPTARLRMVATVYERMTPIVITAAQVTATALEFRLLDNSLCIFDSFRSARSTE